jgi:RimJ/RimL family protein N-acetyltransferase
VNAAVTESAAAARAAPQPWIRSRRLALREFCAADLDDLVAMHRDPRLLAHLVEDHPLDQVPVVRLFLERIAAFYRRHEGLGIWHAAAADATGGSRFAGMFNLMPMSASEHEVQLGSRLVPACWGGGLALEGCERLLEHAFDGLGRARVWGVCHPGNRPAQAVLRALGFEALGTLPYEGVPASHFRIGVNAWRDARNSPLGTRMRHALRALRGASADPRQETLDAPDAEAAAGGA